MECNQFNSVAALMDVLVRSAHARRSRVSLPDPPVRAPVSSKPLTDFSICSILGLANDVAQSLSGPECHSDTSPPLSPYSDYASPRPSHRATSPLLTSYSDITSSSSVIHSESFIHCDSESDQLPTYSEQPPRKKRQRTIFSRNEVLELEEAFRRRPYLTAYDHRELGQRLGIPAKSVKYWFQNRRAKSRKLERKMTSVHQTNPANQFGPPVSTDPHSRRLQFVNGFPQSDHWKQAECISCPLTEEIPEDQPQYSRPFRPARHRSSVQSNQFRGDHFSLMFHSDQLKIRPAEPARVTHKRAIFRLQPY